MAGKKEFSAGVVKALKSFFQLFSVPDSECGQSVESWSWRSNNMVRGLISERSYPWAVKPPGLNGSIRHRLSGEGSGGELQRSPSSLSAESRAEPIAIQQIAVPPLPSLCLEFIKM